jgi:hypothetical protein
MPRGLSKPREAALEGRFAAADAGHPSGGMRELR